MTLKTDTIRANCNQCGGEKNQLIMHAHRENWTEDLGSPDEPGPIQHGFNDYRLIKCCGCDSISLRHESWCNDWGPESCLSYYPPARFRRLPKWIEGVDSLRFILEQTFVPRLLTQIYTAYHSKSYALAAMGIRALVEQTMVDKVGDKGNFVANLKAFETAGYLSTVQRKFLETTLELGHAAIHRGYEPTDEDIRRALDITEPLLETVYIHDGHANHLQRSVPTKTSKSNINR